MRETDELDLQDSKAPWGCKDDGMMVEAMLRTNIQKHNFPN